MASTPRGGGRADSHVNQGHYINLWAAFGTVCTTGGTVTITLANDGGDARLTEGGTGAIPVVRTGLAC
jgi:hypothetical protein